MDGPYFPHLPPLLLLAPALVAYLAALTWLYRRGAEGVRPAAARSLAALRWVVVLILALCLCEPVWREYRVEKQRGMVAVLVDDSASMGLADGPEGATRLDEARRAVLGRDGLVDRLRQAMRVRAFRFDTDLRLLRNPAELSAEGRLTDLASAVSEALRRLAPEGLSTVILCTDGAHNASTPLAPVVEVLRRNGVALYAVGFGRASGHKDIQLLNVTVDRRVTLDTEVEATVTILAGGFDGVEVPLALRRGEVVQERRVRLRDGEQRVTVAFKVRDRGLLQYEVEVPPQPGEFLRDNNRQTFAVNAFERKLHVLYMEGTQYRIPDRRLWEFQYLVQALEEDKDIAVKPLLRDDFAAARKAGVATVRDPAAGFPRKRRDLWNYDVIICSDVDIEYFTREQVGDTVDFVERHGGGYCMVGGYTAFGAGGYDESPIDKMLPVDMQGRQDGYTENEPFRWQVTEDGWRHPIMQVAKDPAANRDIWAKMPMLRGFNHVLRAKPAATTLAAHPTRRTLYGPNVLLAAQPYGRGRTLAMVTDTTAGWGADFEDQWGEGGDNRHFRRFWQNAVRWLAAYRLRVPRSLVLLATDRNVYEPGERVRFEAQAWDEQCEPATQATLTLTVRRPGDGEPVALRMSPDLGRPGFYEAAFHAAQEGVYEARVASAVGGQTLGEDAALFTARPTDREMRDYPLREGLLRSLAEQTGGAYAASPDAAALAGRLVQTTHAAKRYTIRPAWAEPWLLAALVALLGAEWWFRRRVGMP